MEQNKENEELEITTPFFKLKTNKVSWRTVLLVIAILTSFVVVAAFLPKLAFSGIITTSIKKGIFDKFKRFSG